MLSIISVFCGAMTQARALNIFLYLENLPGESLDEKHQDWIDVDSFSHGISHGPGPVRPAQASLVVQKRVDKTSPKLDLFCNRGTTISNAVLEVTRLVEQEVRFYKIKLTNVIVLSIQIQGYSGSDHPGETVIFSYESI